MEDKRDKPRHWALKAASIVFNAGGASIDCVVRNVSDAGALLQVESQVGVPDRFDLVLASDESRRPCRVTRRAGGSIAVAFQ